jgi:hypothetical protein
MLIILLSIAGILALLIFWVVLTPVSLIVNSARDQYEIRQRWTFRFGIHLAGEFRKEFSIFGFTVPERGKKPAAEKPAKKPTKKNSLKRSPEAWRGLIRSIFHSLKVNRVRLDIDTGDVVTNATLVPLAMLASRGGCQFQTNFVGRVLVDIKITFYPYKSVGGFILFLIKH